MNAMARPKKVPAFFYATETGNEPVRDWLKSLTKEDRVAIGNDIQSVEVGWPVGLPLCKPIGNGLWEVRSDLRAGRTARVFFGFIGGRMILLHGFIKKSQKTPTNELELAQHRLKKVRDTDSG